MKRWIVGLSVAAIVVGGWVTYVTLASAPTTLAWAGSVVLALIVAGITNADRQAPRV